MKTKLFVSLVLIYFVQAGIVEAQDVRKKEQKVQVSKKMDENGTEIKVEITEEDGSVFSKTYTSEEEMKNDPDLKDYNIFFHHGDGVTFEDHNHDANFNVIVESDEELHDGEAKRHIWMKKMDMGESSSNYTMVFKEGDGAEYKIEKDADGNMTITKDGIEIEAEEFGESVHVKINKLEDGTIVILDGDDKIKEFEDGEGDANFFFLNDELDNITEIEDLNKDGDKMVIIKRRNADGNVTMELKGGVEWIHEEDHNEFITEDGDHVKVFVKKVEKVHVEILDLHEIKEFDDVPGINLTSEKFLELEDLNFYPNPNDGAFTVRFSGKKRPTEIRVVDMMGQEVYRENLGDFGGTYDKEIDLSGSNQGVYIMQIRQGDRSMNKKIVIE